MVEVWDLAGVLDLAEDSGLAGVSEPELDGVAQLAGVFLAGVSELELRKLRRGPCSPEWLSQPVRSLIFSF